MANSVTASSSTERMPSAVRSGPFEDSHEAMAEASNKEGAAGGGGASLASGVPFGADGGSFRAVTSRRV